MIYNFHIKLGLSLNVVCSNNSTYFIISFVVSIEKPLPYPFIVIGFKALFFFYYYILSSNISLFTLMKSRYAS